MRKSSCFASGLLLLCAFTSGCMTESSQTTGDNAPSPARETLPASAATTSALHVVRWATWEDTAGRFVVALDAANTELARLAVHQAAAGVIEVEGISPAQGKVVVSSEGAVTGASGSVRDLAAALASDARAQGSFQPEAAGSDGAALAVASAPQGGPVTNATGVRDWGTFHMGFNFFDTDGRNIVGALCPGTPRDNNRVLLLNGNAICTDEGWVSSDPYDCRFFMRWHEFSTQSGTCYWEYSTNTCGHPLCQAGAALDGTCGNCAANICGVDSYCCNVAWDSICVAEVNSVCHTGC